MKLEDFTNEMLDEIKSAKDLVKSEFPEIAKEYLRAQKIISSIFIVLGLIGMVLASISACYGYHYIPTDRYDDNGKSLMVVGVFIALGSLIPLGGGICTLLDAVLQPRRVAIKAITSLKDIE